VTLFSHKVANEQRDPVAAGTSAGAPQPASAPPRIIEAVELEGFIDRGSVVVEYQPKISLKTNQVSQFGVEALCRINDPQAGRIMPDQFVPTAESSGLIAKLTDAVVSEAFRAWHSWNADGLCLRIALNVSPILLKDEVWQQGFLERCSEFKMNPKWITLEITETAAGATNVQSREILEKLHEKGFALSIDDFGTGYSSLSTLYRLPIGELKIDKSFIFDLLKKGGAQHLVESAISMAKRMGIKVVAEGVESESLFEELRRIGCDEIQGYFIGKSMPADKVVPFFTAWKQSRPETPHDNATAAGLPKVAIIQALLNELMHDDPGPARAALGSYASAGTPAPTHGKERANELLKKLPPLILERKTLQALAHCHTIVQECGSIPGSNSLRAKVGQLQEELERELVTSGDFELRSAMSRFRLLRRDSITLARPSPSSAVDIPIRCRWLPPGEKGLRIFRKADEFFIEDRGSSKGYLVDGTKLNVQRPFPISYGQTAIEINLASGATAPLTILLENKSSDPDALLIDFDYDSRKLQSELGEKEWSEIKDELALTFVLFGGSIHLGRSSDCAIRLNDCAAQVAASISSEGGYWIAPAQGTSFKIGDTSFSQRMPLILDTEIELSGCALALHKIYAKPR
jgi:EAL domain-containing protein (putative c-di-GMP-specific phosphodiesterase class I)